jgi:hypothetical protein
VLTEYELTLKPCDSNSAECQQHHGGIVACVRICTLHWTPCHQQLSAGTSNAAAHVKRDNHTMITQDTRLSKRFRTTDSHSTRGHVLHSAACSSSSKATVRGNQPLRGPKFALLHWCQLGLALLQLLLSLGLRAANVCWSSQKSCSVSVPQRLRTTASTTNHVPHGMPLLIQEPTQ